MKTKFNLKRSLGWCLLTTIGMAMSALGQSFSADFTSTEGYINGSLNAGSQAAAPYFTVAGNGSFTVNASAGTAAAGSFSSGSWGPIASYAQAVPGSGNVTMSTKFVLGSGSFNDGMCAGYGPGVTLSGGIGAYVYSQSVGYYRFMTESGNVGLFIPANITTDTLQIKVVKNGSSVVDTLTDLNTGSVLATTTGSVTVSGNQTATFTSGCDTTAVFSNFSVATPAASGSSFVTDFTAADGYVSGSLKSSVQLLAPYFTLSGNGDVVVNPTLGTATNSISGVVFGPTATCNQTLSANLAVGTTVTVSTDLILGSGDFDDGGHGGNGPILSSSSGAWVEIYSQSVGSYRFITESGNNGMGIPANFTTDELQIRIVETVNSNGTITIVDTLTDLTRGVVISSTTGTESYNGAAQTISFSGGCDPTAAFTELSIGGAATVSSGTLTADFTSAEGYTNGSLNAATQTGAPYFNLSGNGTITVNATAGTAACSSPNTVWGPIATCTQAVTSSGTVTVSANFILGSGVFNDGVSGGYGPGVLLTGGIKAYVYSQSVGSYRFITDSGNLSIGTPNGITSDTLQIKIVESGSVVVDSLTDLTSGTVLATTTGSATASGNLSAAFTSGYDPTTVFTQFSETTNGTVIPPSLNPPVITSSTSVSGIVGTPFNYAIIATNTPTSYSATGLPAGLGINTTSGVISGTPTVAGTSSATIKALNAAGIGQATLTVTIATAGQPSGFFTTYKDGNGVWWLKDPNGNPMVSKGLDFVRFQGYSDNNGVYPLGVANQAKYGSWNNWAATMNQRMVSFGFNTYGAWTDAAITGGPADSTHNTGVTPILSIGNNYYMYYPGIQQLSGFPDAFDPQFQQHAEYIAQTELNDGWTLCPLDQKNNPWIIGWFSDNELNWGPPGVYGMGYTLLIRFCSQPSISQGQTVYCHQAAINFLQGRYGTIQALNAAWGTPFTDWSQIGANGQFPYAQTGPMETDADDFSGVVAEQYFTVCNNAIKKYDPNHLYIGCRFSGPPPIPVLQAAARHADVISFNLYAWDPSSDLSYYVTNAGIDKPMLIGEYCFRASQNSTGDPNSVGSGPIVNTQDDRANAYETYTRLAVANRHIVSINWFDYCDEPAGGRSGDNENSNMGIVDINDNVYTSLTSRMSSINPQIEALHAASH